MKKIFLFISFIFHFTNAIFAQGEANIWYFGLNAGLDFNSGGPVALTNGALNTFEGCSTISTSAGSLLFYTDGITVWNNLHNAMPNGTGLLGDASATQSGIIVPKPGTNNIYYVFTVAATGGPAGLKYSEVDMNLQGGLGDVTAIKNINLAAPVTEKLTAVKKANNIDYWVIAHNATNGFLVYSVTSAGVNTTPIVSNAGTIDSNSGNLGVGYLKASASGTMLAQAISNNSIVDILNFDNITGIVTNNFSLTSVNQWAYGTEFSPDGSRLYVVGWADEDIFQYNMTLGSSAAIIASATLIGTTTGTYGAGALQIAPDGKIYFAKNDEGTLGCINFPNTLGLGCGFVDNAVNLAGKISGHGLPNFIQTFFIAPGITYTNTCEGDSTLFSLTDTTAIDSVHWSFNDPASGVFNSSTLTFPFHVFSSIGNYTVSAITYAGSITDTVSVALTITGLPVVSIGNDTTVCNVNSIVLDPGPGYQSYLWQNASTNQTFNVTALGTYFVSVSNSCGTGTDTIHITGLPSTAITVNSPFICYGQTATLTANGANNYSWSNGSLANPLIVSPTTTTTYQVTATDTNGCFNTVTSTVTVNPQVASYAGPDVNICSGATTQLNATGGVTYSWSPTLGLDNALISNPVSSVSSTTTYTVTVTDANNCSNTDQVLITVNPNPSANFSVSPLCANNPSQFNDLSVGGANNFTWNFGDGNSSNLANPLHTYSAAGNYTVTLIATGAGACSSSISLPVIINPLPATPVVISNSPVCGGDTFQLGTSSAGGLSYLWTGPNSFSSTFQNMNILSASTNMSGTYTLFVTNIATGCVSETSSINIVVNNSPPSPEAEATNLLCYGDTLLLTTSASAETYLWNGPNAYTSDLQNPIITDFRDSKAGLYTLIVSNSSGCTAQDTITVLMDCEDIAALFVPNVFTPNGDNENQIFKLVAADLKDVQVDIYDRWGINLYSWNTLQGGWDGKTKKGLEAPSGTYFYIINATSYQGRVLSKQGSFTLLR